MRRNRTNPDEVFKEMLQAARELLAVRSPLDAELMVSDMVGAWWGRRVKGGDVEQVLGEGLVDYAAKAGTPASLTLLICLAYLGTARQGAKAEGAALAMMESGVARPGWADRVGAVKPTGCYVSRDAYGDQDTVLCTFAYSGQDRHALVLVVDYNMRGMARDAWVSSEVEKLLEQARAEAEANAMLTFHEIEPQQARALLDSAMRSTRESKPRPPVSDSYSAYHAFARSRLKALPPGRKRPAPLHSEAPYSRERRAMLAAEFLASDEAEHLSDRSAASRCADHIIDYGISQDFGRPLRVSPAKCETFLLTWLPAKVMLSPEEQEAMPHVLSAWSRFAARKSALPDRGLKATLDAIWEAMATFPEAYRDPAALGLDRALLERLLPDGDLSALARRLFAFPPLPGADDLNPADPADRRRLLAVDHGGELDEQHLAWHEEIATRLWEGDPPEMWEAAQRLLDLGHDREEVLHVLIEIVERIGGDPEELATALDDIAEIPDEF
ncbi:hypothetical protein HNR30_008121 [Nonomuraea soli]|uniref:Uncharacterized protein n=2 Tax=Nonomuraea soli TaxID=1032476 RepID=A0A7W0CSZ1_9ACTN|nr:hypothetical protein [Nonomuraea soli]